MNVPIHLRRPIVRLAMLSAAALAVGLFLPVDSTASQSGAAAEERATQAEERSARRAQERATRVEEREARRAAHIQERETRRAAREKERAERHNARSVSGGGARGESSDGTPGESIGGGPGESRGERASAQHACHLTVAATANRITMGETVTVSGKLLCSSGVSAAEVPVTIYRHQQATALAMAGGARTAADGSFQLAPAAFATNSILYVRAANARTVRVSVRVAPHVSLIAPSPSSTTQASAASGRSRSRVARVTFTGSVSPDDTGALVTLQIAYVESGERWRPVAFGRVEPDGSYSIAHAFRIPGAAKVRSIVQAGRLNMAAGISEALPYEVAQPQNPRLTIQTSADPIAYGQSVTISGIAAGAGPQPVTLLARTQGNAFAVVATDTTDASGHYTFTQEPLQRTHYRVTDATAQSAALFESVGFALAAGATPNTVQAGQQLTFSGTLAPARAGQVVYLERAYASGIGFYVVDAGTVDAASEYTIVHSFATAGTSLMRIRVPTDGERDGSTGTLFTVTVTP